jgi:hypothetical protein
MKKFISILLLSVLITINLQAQKRILLVAFDSVSRQPIPLITIVQYVFGTDSIKQTKLTDNEGKAGFSVNESAVRFKIFHLNYLDLDTTIVLGNKNEMQFAMKRIVKDIDEVTIFSQRKTIELMAGGYTYSPDRKVVNVSRNAAELLKHLPGILQDKDGKLNFLGANITFWIDGKQSAAGGQEIQGLLPTEIKSITVYNTPPSYYDACCGNVVEIITYQNVKKGIVANINGNIATGDKQYIALSLKYNNKRYSGLFKASYNHYRTRFVDYELDQVNYLLDDSLCHYKSTGNSKNQVLNTLSLYNSHDFALKGKAVIGFVFKYNDYERAPYTINDDLLIYNKQNVNKARQQFVRSNTSSNRFGFGGVSYRRTLNAKGSNLSAEVSVLLRKTTSDFSQMTRVYDGDNNFLKFYDILNNNISSKADVYTAIISITHDITPKISSRFGGKLIGIRNANKFKGLLSTDAVLYYEDLQNTYTLNYNENIQALFFSMSGALRKVRYSLGIRWEGTGTEISSQNRNSKVFSKNNYSNLFPSLSLNLKVSKSTTLGLGINRTIIRIPYAQLNPLVRRINSVVSVIGDPYLKPILQEAATFTLNTVISKRHSVNFMVKYSISHNPWLSILYADTIPGQFIEKNTTYKSSNSVYANLNYRGDFTDWFSVNANIYAHNTWNDFNRIFNLPNPRYKFTHGLNIGLLFGFWKNANLEIKGKYVSPFPLPQGREIEGASTDISFSKSVLRNGALQVYLDIEDVFNSSNTIRYNDYPAFKSRAYSKQETRIVTLSIAYKFGKERKNKIRDYQIQNDNRFAQ